MMLVLPLQLLMLEIILYLKIILELLLGIKLVQLINRLSIILLPRVG